MATNYFANITKKGTLAQFNAAMETAPNVWQDHAQQIPSDTGTETHVWTGTLPEPREFISGRNFGGIRDFTFDIANKTYELSYLINRESMEDDRHGLVNKRTMEAAQVWATFKDKQLATLLEAGDTSTATYDGTALFADTRTIGGSANIDNSLTRAVTASTNLTSAEAGLVMQDAFTALAGFQDDHGRAGYNASSMQQLRVIAHPQYVRGFTEFLESTQLSNSDNPWGKGLAQLDILNYLTAATVTLYVHAVGSPTRAVVYQERTPLEIEVFNGTQDVALNNGVMVLCRQRYCFAYGEPRRAIEHVLTTA